MVRLAQEVTSQVVGVATEAHGRFFPGAHGGFFPGAHGGFSQEHVVGFSPEAHVFCFFYFYRKRVVEPRGGFFTGTTWQPKMAGKLCKPIPLFVFPLAHGRTTLWEASPHGKTTRQDH